MKKTKKINFFHRLIKERFRITFFHDDFKPVFSLRFTLFSLILSLIGYATFIVIITTFIISKTSLKEYIPGYGTEDEKKQIIELYLKVDSLQTSIAEKNLYLNTILKILNGKDNKDTSMPHKNIPATNTYTNLKASKNEKEIRNEIEKELHHNIIMTSSSSNNYSTNGFSFLPPTDGIVISEFNPSTGHFGIDISGKNYTPIRSIDKGLIIYSAYSVTDGNFIIILHPNELISVYKHLSIILKKTGEYVTANEIIGNMGNSGTESNGVHLHFELWYKNQPINPTEYIFF